MGIQINGNTDNISATDGGLTVSDLEINQSGISTFNNALNIGTGSSIFSPATNTLTFGTNSAERLRIGSSGQIGIAGANYGTSGQVLTSGGSGSAATWSTISGTTINNNANNRIITGSGTANTLEAETSLEWNGTDTLTVVHPSSYPDFKVRTSAGGGSFEMFSCGNGPFRIRSASTSPDSSADELVVGATSGDRGLTIFGSSNNICFGDADDSDIGRLQYVHSDNSMRFFTNTSERLRIDSSGRLGVGVNSFHDTSTRLQLQSPGSDHTGIVITAAATSTLSYIYFGDTADKDIGRLVYENSSDSMQFWTNNAERLRIDSSGRLLIGTSSHQEAYGTSALQIAGTSGATSSMSLIRHGNSPYLTLGSSGGSSLGAVTALSSGNRIGQLTFAGADGTDINTHAASIAAYVDGSVSSNNVPARIVFATGPTETERLRITSAGSVLSSTSFVSKATADVNVTLNTSSGFTANTYVTVINHGVLEEESVYIISFKWNHGSSGQQPYFSHGAFVFNPSEVNTGSTGGQGQNHIPFQGHHMHTGVNRYWSFRYYGATGGTSVHGLQAAFDQTLGNGTFTIRATKIAKVTTI